MPRTGLLIAVALVLALLAVFLATTDLWRVERVERAPDEHHGTEASKATETERAEAAKGESRALSPSVDLDTVDTDRDLHGTVVEKDGPPIAGAELVVVRYPGRRTTTLDMDRFFLALEGERTRSAGDGTFSVRLRRGDSVSLRVRAEGFAPMERPYLQAGERVKVEMVPGVTLVVTCLDEEKHPVPDVEIRTFRIGRPADTTIDRKGVTDASGVARLEGLPPAVTAALECQHHTLGYPGWIRLDLPESGEMPFEVTMPKGRTITGTVTDAATGEPLEGVRVGIGWVMHKPAFTDVDGRYTLTGWTGKGNREIAVDKPGYWQDRKNVDSAETIDFELMPGGSVAGRIVNAAAEPIPNVYVSAIGYSHRGKTRLSHRHTDSDASGQFRLEGLRTDLVHALVLIKQGYGRTIVDFDPKPPAAGPVDVGDVTMPEARSIEGVVYDAAGEPIPRTQIDLSGANADRNRLLGRALTRWQVVRYGNSEERYTDHLGRFRFPDLAPGKYKLTVRAEGGSPAEKEIVLAAQDLLDVEIRFGSTSKFVVWVHDEDGDPVGNAFISVQYEGGRAQSRTDQEGRALFAIKGVVTRINPPWILGDQPFLRAKAIENPPKTQTEARFVLKRGGTISGQVVQESGKPLAGARIAIRQGEKRITSTTCDDAGKFKATVPVDGSFDVVLTGVRKNRGGAFTVDKEAPYAGELKGVVAGSRDLVLRATRIATDRSITVRVLAPDGSPIEGANVSAQGKPLFEKTNAEGVVTFTGLPAREIRIFAGLSPSQNPEGYVLDEGATVVPEGQEVVLRFVQGVPFSGTVRKPDGSPAIGAQIFTRGRGRGLSVTVTDAEGRFTLNLPPDPTWRLLISARLNTEDGERYTAQAANVAPDAVDFELKLKKIR